MSVLKVRTVVAAGVLLGSGCASACKPGGDAPTGSNGSKGSDGEARIALVPVEATDEAGLRVLIWPPQGVEAYVALEGGEIDALRSAVAGLVSVRDFEDPDLPSIATSAAKAGFDLRRFTIEGRPLVALLDGKSRGAGAFLFWLDASATGTALILQAPHAFFDTNTGSLALGGFLGASPPPSALFVNTLHRYVGADGSRNKRARDENPSDAAHNPEHAFAVATASAAKALAPRRVTVLQLHGFGADPNTTADKGAIVVSAGRKAGSTPTSTEVARALTQLELGRVVRYPEQAERLGATTNVQRRALETVPNADFVHVEMSSDVRATLKDERSQLISFTEALTGATQGGRGQQ